MKTIIATLVAAMALTTPTFGQVSFGGQTNASRKALAFFNMSNNSAAEIIVGETSMGNVTAAEVSLALGNMSAAERIAFFDADTPTRRQIIAAQLELMNGDSAAETAADEKAADN